MPISRAEHLEARYANYFQIGHNAFEFLLDFGQEYEEHDAILHTRVITGPSFAKKLFETLQQAVEAYEAEFGVIGEEK